MHVDTTKGEDYSFTPLNKGTCAITHSLEFVLES